MANESNLKPVRTESEARRKGKKGGIASGKARKENKLLKIVLELLIGIAVGLIVGFCIYKFGWNQ